MADPKPLIIIKEIAVRLQQIKIANGYHADRGDNVRRESPGEIIPIEEAPVIFVFSDTAISRDDKGLGIIADSGFTVEAVMVVDINYPPEDLVHYAFADIHRAVEQPWDSVRQKDSIIGKYRFESDEPVRSAEQSNLIAVRVNYSFSFSRKYGES